jgi:hypothetical protein
LLCGGNSSGNQAVVLEAAAGVRTACLLQLA